MHVHDVLSSSALSAVCTSSRVISGSLSLMFMGSCPLMVVWFLIKLVAVLRPSLHGGFRFRQCVSIFVVDDFGLRRPLSSDFFNHFANFLWVLVRLFQMSTPLFEIISLVFV